MYIHLSIYLYRCSGCDAAVVAVMGVPGAASVAGVGRQGWGLVRRDASGGVSSRRAYLVCERGRTEVLVCLDGGLTRGVQAAVPGAVDECGYGLDRGIDRA